MALSVSFYANRGAPPRVRLRDGAELERSAGGSTFTVRFDQPLEPNKSVDIEWSSSGPDVFYRDHRWFARAGFAPESIDKQDSDEIAEHAKKSDSFELQMAEWLDFIEGTGSRASNRLRKWQLFFYSIEKTVHDRAPESDEKGYASTLIEWLRMRNHRRALEAKEGRPLGGSIESRQQELNLLTDDIRDAAKGLEVWLSKLVDQLCADAPLPAAEELGIAFDAFCTGSLLWPGTPFGIPDSPQVSLFAEIAILFRQLELNADRWRLALPAFVRGIEIFCEMAWTGEPRRETSYLAQCYMEPQEQGQAARLRQYPSQRLLNLRDTYSTGRVNTPIELARLEYQLGCLCFTMRSDKYATATTGSTYCAVEEARHATLDSYLIHLAKKPIPYADGKHLA